MQCMRRPINKDNLTPIWKWFSIFYFWRTRHDAWFEKKNLFILFYLTFEIKIIIKRFSPHLFLACGLLKAFSRGEKKREMRSPKEKIYMFFPLRNWEVYRWLLIQVLKTKPTKEFILNPACKKWWCSWRWNHHRSMFVHIDEGQIWKVTHVHINRK